MQISEKPIVKKFFCPKEV